MREIIKRLHFLGPPIEAAFGLICGLCLAQAGRFYLEGSPTFALIVAGLVLAFLVFRFLGNLMDVFFNSGMDAIARKIDPDHFESVEKKFKEDERIRQRWERIALVAGIVLGGILGMLWRPLDILLLVT